MLAFGDRGAPVRSDPAHGPGADPSTARWSTGVALLNGPANYTAPAKRLGPRGRPSISTPARPFYRCLTEPPTAGTWRSCATARICFRRECCKTLGLDAAQLTGPAPPTNPAGLPAIRGSAAKPGLRHQVPRAEWSAIFRRSRRGRDPCFLDPYEASHPHPTRATGAPSVPDRRRATNSPGPPRHHLRSGRPRESARLTTPPSR